MGIISSSLGIKKVILPQKLKEEVLLKVREPYTIIKESDLIIVFGSRLSVPFIQGNLDKFNGKTKLIVIDIDNSELMKHTIKPNGRNPRHS